MPISRITELVASEACATWLTRLESPIDASTAENASSTGTPAATNAPNASSRITKVIGTERRSACDEVVPDRLVQRVIGARFAELARS